jgi:hypothetical protein
MTVLWILTIFMCASIILDVETTLAVLSQGGSETNPIMAWVLKLSQNSRFPIYCVQAVVQFVLAGVLLHWFSVLSTSIFCATAAAIHTVCGVQNWRLLK